MIRPRFVPLSSGVAKCATTYGAVGDQMVKAEYLGTPGYTVSASAAYREVVQAVPALASAVDVSAATNPVLVGRAVDAGGEGNSCAQRGRRNVLEQRDVFH